MAVDFSIEFNTKYWRHQRGLPPQRLRPPVIEADMATQFRLRVDIPSCTIMIPLMLDRVASATTFKTLRSMRPSTAHRHPQRHLGPDMHVHILVRKGLPPHPNGFIDPRLFPDNVREILTHEHIVARYAVLGEKMWRRHAPIRSTQDAIRGLYRIADDQGPVEFPVMLKAISRLFNRRVANAIARRLLLRLQECADKARGVIMNGGLIADLFAPREGIFYLPGGPTPGIPEIYNILRARERTAHGRPHAEILSDADIAGLSPQLRARILRLKKNASP
jgi:hypothetical protein